MMVKGSALALGTEEKAARATIIKAMKSTRCFMVSSLATTQTDHLS
jgi:hypothetical protein